MIFRHVAATGFRLHDLVDRHPAKSTAALIRSVAVGLTGSAVSGVPAARSAAAACVALLLSPRLSGAMLPLTLRDGVQSLDRLVSGEPNSAPSSPPTHWADKLNGMCTALLPSLSLSERSAQQVDNVGRGTEGLEQGRGVV